MHSLSWRDGSGSVELAEAPLPSCEPSGAGLETLDALDALDEPPPPVHSIAGLLAQKKGHSSDLDRWKRSIQALPGVDTQTLVLRISTTADPLTVWALHMHLDKRGVAPCLRWPANASAAQMVFITWAADVLWFTKRNRTHIAKFQSWQRLLEDDPGSEHWRERAYRIFFAMHGRQNISSYTARGLALTPDQRQPLMMLPTARMAADRQELRPAAFEDTRQRLLTHAMTYPDKSGRYSPEAIANRRVRLWRVHVLSGKRPADTAKNWTVLTGESAKRQVIARHIATIEKVLLA